MTRWQIFSAIALRRLPLIEPQINPIESKVKHIFSKWEVAKSRFSDHELEHLQDTTAKENPENDVILKETAQDKLDAWTKEKNNFVFGAHEERLTKTEYLFMKQKFGTDIKDQWLLPQAIYDGDKDENLLDTARRALLETLNIVNGYRIVSKIPSSVYTFRYPKKIKELTGYHGAKVFFLKAQLDEPGAKVLESVDSSKNTNLKWQTNQEAFEIVDKSYMKSFSTGLLNENEVDINRVIKTSLNYAKSVSRLAEQVRQ